MATASGSSTNNVLFCWDQVLRTNRLFRVSHAFAPRLQAPRLLALYALFGAIEEICSECSDDTVALRKLDWWRQECQPEQRPRSQHPVVRQLVESGADQGLSPAPLGRLFDHTLNRLDAPAPSDLTELRRLCEAVGRPLFELELAVCGGAEQLSSPELGAAASIGLLQLLRESARTGSRRPHWWVPMNLLARHGVHRAGLGSGIERGATGSLFLDLLEQCSDWWRPGARPGSSTDAGNADARRHLRVMCHLQSRRLAHRKRSGLESVLRQPDRPRMSDVYVAWRAARRVSRL